MIPVDSECGKAEPDEGRLEQARDAQVHLGGSYKSFAELTASEVAERAEELKSAGSWGPMQKVAKVALAWSMLAARMKEQGIETVGGLDPEEIVRQAERTWVIPPEEGMI